MRTYNSHKGLMLLELLLSMVIVSFMIVAVAIIFTGALRDWKVKDPKLLLQQEATIAMNKIERQLKKAGSIYYAGDKSVVFPPLSLAAPEADTYTISLWRFDEGSGTNANDETGTNNGTLKAPGEPDWVGSDNGESEDALRFDGNDDYVDCGNGASLRIKNKLTLGAWLQPNSGAIGNGAIIYMDTAYRLYLNDSGYLTGGIYYSGDWHDIISNRTVPRNGSTWTHTALTYDKDEETGEELKLYINGHNVATANHTHSIKTSSDNLYIGYDGTKNQYPFDGVIDEVHVSNDVRRTRIFWGGGADDKPTLIVNGVSHQLVHECNTDTFLINYYDEDYNELTPLVGTDTQKERNFIKIVKVLLGLEKDSQKFSLENVIALREEKSKVVEDVVAYWKMDENLWDGTPNEVKDSSGNNNHGTAHGNATTTADGWVNRAGIFDGSGDYVDCINDNSLDVDYITVESWVKFTSNSGNRVIASYDDGTNRRWALYLLNGNTLRFFVFVNNAAKIIDYSWIPQLDTWYHIVGVKSATHVRTYINGKEVGTPQAHPGVIDKDPYKLRIGVGNYPGYFNGTIDEVKIYNRALSEEEIKEAIGFTDSMESDFSGTYDDTIWETDHIELSHP